jgi:hypothetical protein
MRFDLTFGKDLDTGRIFEVFFAGMSEGSSMQGLLTAFCVMVSRALQRGDDPNHMLDGTIGVMPFPPSGFAFTRSDVEEKNLGEVPSVTYLIVKAVEWASAGFPDEFKWS